MGAQCLGPVKLKILTCGVVRGGGGQVKIHYTFDPPFLVFSRREKNIDKMELGQYPRVGNAYRSKWRTHQGLRLHNVFFSNLILLLFPSSFSRTALLLLPCKTAIAMGLRYSTLLVSKLDTVYTGTFGR